ncbi:hypothetical protein GFY24_04245 [Nocardia sp. SYP-A9097]|uniref:hypothetical protein n=1 Tax=Nocardia sp. SYP-A9097 TaxID=2663237 RepID=UPI00129BF4FF|nr:hypothetical protein [Nocardia sp. SYP-A9097]MRH86687.1 hypothetical protein [Nocardia sp. SYP-A9097]
MQYGGGRPEGDRAALDRVLADARAVQIREMRGDSKSLLVERDPVAVQALREALRVTDEPGLSCMCFGDVSLVFLDTSGRELTGVTLHHGDSVRWDDAARWGGWRDDAILVDSARSLEWLAVRGVTWPLREFRESQRRAAAALRARLRWTADIPASIASFTAMFLETTDRGVPLLEPELIEVRARLLAAHPDPVDRTARLLAWYGSGTGSSAGYPTHEAIPAQFLDQEQPVDFARAVETGDARALLGTVRYLVSWPGRQRLTPLLTHLSPATQRKILDHAPTAKTRAWLERRLTGLH